LFGVHIEDLVELEGPFLLLVINVTLVLVLGDVELSSALLLVETCLATRVLNPLNTFLCGRTLRMISIAEFLDISNKIF
jgi:hypothetical protein